MKTELNYVKKYNSYRNLETRSEKETAIFVCHVASCHHVMASYELHTIDQREYNHYVRLLTVLLQKYR